MSSRAGLVGADDRARIENLLAGFVLALDAHDIDAAAAALAEQVTWDYASVNGRPAATLSREALAARWRGSLVHADASQHFLGLPHLVGTGDRATCRVPARVEIRLANRQGGPAQITHGSYTFTVRRDPEGAEGWLIEGVTMSLLWNEGNPQVMALAAERGAANEAS